MEPSRSFFVSVLLGFFIASGGFFGMIGLQLGTPTRRTLACLEMLEHKERAAGAVQGSKLVVIGGSSSLFSVRAGEIQKATGVPAVNLATHAGLGPGYILERAKPLLHPGDTALLVLEYELYDQSAEALSDWTGPFAIEFYIGCDPAYFRSLPLSRQADLALRQPFRQIRKGVEARFSPPKPYREGLYNVAHLDSNGDLSGHEIAGRPARTKVAAATSVDMGIMNTNAGAWPMLNDFLEWARRNDVRVLAAYPTVSDISAPALPGYQAKLNLIRRFFNERQVPVLGTARDAMYPEDNFYDTGYHLSYEASLDHTARLIQWLRPYLKSRAGGDEARLNNAKQTPESGATRH